MTNQVPTTINKLVISDALLSSTIAGFRPRANYACSSASCQINPQGKVLHPRYSWKQWGKKWAPHCPQHITRRFWCRGRCGDRRLKFAPRMWRAGPSVDPHFDQVSKQISRNSDCRNKSSLHFRGNRPCISEVWVHFWYGCRGKAADHRIILQKPVELYWQGEKRQSCTSISSQTCQIKRWSLWSEA